MGGVPHMAFSKLRKFPSVPALLHISIMKGVKFFCSALRWSCGFFPYILLVWSITLIFVCCTILALQEKNPTWS